MKRFLSIVLTVCMLLAFCAMPAMAEEMVTVVVDGSYVDCASYGQEALIVEGRTLVPLRAVFEALGATVSWDNEKREAVSERGDVKISLAVDSTELYVNGEVKTIDVPAQLMNNRTMVPVRAVAEAFGCIVKWDNDTRTAVISTSENAKGIDKPDEVVKKCYEAISTMNFEQAETYFKNYKDLAKYAGYGDFTSGEITSFAELTAEEKELVETIMAPVIGLIEFEVTGYSIEGKKADVNIKITVPDFSSVDFESVLTDEVVYLLMEEVLKEYGYTVETVQSVTDEALIAEMEEALILATTIYSVEIMAEMAKDMEKVSEENTVSLSYDKGKWLIVG